MTIPKKGITADRKTPEKINFLINNYSQLTRKQLSEKLNESPRWIKRQLKRLIQLKYITYKQPPLDNPLSESDWTPEIKSFIFELRQKYLKPNHYIIRQLKENFNLNIKIGALQFWLDKFKCFSRSKQDWMNEYLSKELIKKLLNKSYRIVDISCYIKEKFNVYISDDLIHKHIQKLDLLNYKLKRLKDIENESKKFSKEWLSQKINEHAGIKGISENMGFSKTIVMKRIKEEGLSLIKHRKIWSQDMEILRDYLLNVPSIKDISTEDFHQMILGWFIGDGHIDLKGQLVINHSLHQISYLYIKIRILKKFVSNIVTIPKNETDKYYGGREQLNISCPGFNFYSKYLNADGSKNYEKIISELNPLGWACYFMDDGSFLNNKTVISINKKESDALENKYCFGKKIRKDLLEIKNIQSFYILPHFIYKFQENTENTGLYWKKEFPEIFNPIIKCDLDLCFVNNYTIEQNPFLLNETIDYYKKRGFPYFSISNEYLKREFDKLSKLKSLYFWKDSHTLRYITTGNYIFKHFMPHMVEAKYRGISPIETFNNYTLFYKVLEYTLKTHRSILPNFVYDNLIHFNGGVVGFPCSVAKAIVEKFTDEGDMVVDPCAGWGGRLIGTVSIPNRNYIGFEPWDKTYQGLNNIIDFLKLKNVSIINSDFDINRAPKSCSLIFTSPPYIDLEIYNKSINMDDWKELMTDIFRYAEKTLISGGFLILNLPRYLEALLPSTSLLKKEPFFWFTSTRKKDFKKAEILYVWSK